jgi:formamidopyrimidine-DNA glycosylase
VPELPEVETVRDGLARWVAGRTIATVEVRHPRAVRRHVAGGDDFAARLSGARIVAASRRGKYLWLPLSYDDDPDTADGADCQSRCRAPGDGRSRRETALVAHLGMSGQLLVQPPHAPDERHLHVRIEFSDSGRELRFVDQRTFGGLLLDRLVPAMDRPDEHVPSEVAHIARDPLDPHFDDALFAERLRRRDSAVKRALLDQTLISGVGNIYAD